MAAFAIASSSWRRSAAGALLCAMLCACGASTAPPQTILAERCLPLSTAAPITLRLLSPGGALRVRMRQRGIAAAASLTGADVSAAALSPDERYGAMSFLADARQPRTYVLRIISRDSPELAGEVCIAAALLHPSDRVRLAAERAFAAAGDDTRARRWRLAFDHYRYAARLFDRIDRERAAEARQAMAQIAYRQLHRDRDSYVLAARALLDFGSGAEPGLRSAIVELQATIVVESKDGAALMRRERALKLLKTAGALAARAPFGAREQARLTLLRGYLEYSTGDGAAAAGFFTQAATACQALKDTECYARARMNSAVLAEEGGIFPVALSGYAEALRSLSPAVAPDLAADIWDNLGRLQWYVGLSSSADRSQRSAIRLYAQIANCDGVRRALSTLGSSLVHVGSVGEALAYLQLATSRDCAPLLLIATDAAREDLQAPNPTVGPLFNRAFGAAEAPRAACGNLPAPAVLSADATTNIFGALLAMGDAATLEGDRETAQRCRAAATPYAYAPRLALRLANALGAGALERGEPQAARAAFLRALAVADQAGLGAMHENRVVAYLGLARAALLAREPHAALGYAINALKLGSARGDVTQVTDCLQTLASGLRQAGAPLPALQTLRTAANLIEQVPIDELDAETRATYLATQHRVFEELTDLLAAGAVAGGHDAGANNWSAFAASERGRARALQYAISQATPNDPQQARPAVAPAAALLAAIGDVAASADGAAGWSAAVGALETLSARESAVPAVDAAQLVSQLDRLGATLVEYAAGPHDMFAFVIDGGDIDVVPLGERRRIGAAAAELYDLLHNPESADDDVQRAARRLAELVLWPLTGRMKKARVVFAADDSLHTVPFAVLPWSQAPDGPLLLQHAEISVVPSALFMTHLPHAPRALGATPRFELFGDSIFQAAAWRRDCSEEAGARAFAQSATADAARDWTESLPRLPGSRSEVLAIASLARASWPGSRIGVHLGCLATPSALRAAADAGSDLLHIATHGYVDALRPRLSALALTREAPGAGSGVFGLGDILAARVSARLVVLSACDTSRGRLLPGEGVLGPAQAFLQSGADSVIASYWRIDDAATAKFMQTFYAHLLTEHLPVATALRRAQLEHAPGGAHSWAGFALFGGPDGVL